jgi:DNA-binding XRE family transcriptional regulator
MSWKGGIMKWGKGTQIQMLWRSVMAERREKRPIEITIEARFVGPRDKMVKLREIADSPGPRETSEAVTIAEAFPGYGEKPLGMALRGARSREGLTQRQLAEMTGVPQRHISEMETGKRQIGKERARRLAEVLRVSDCRVFL